LAGANRTTRDQLIPYCMLRILRLHGWG
jgi:hypothetical protein